MKRWRLILTLGISAAALLMAVWLSDSPEPYYRGQRLSAWWAEFDRLPSEDGTPASWESERAKLTNVVHSIGTNALPFYIACLDYKPTPKWYDKLADWVGDKTSGRARLPQREDRTLQAQTCFEILGPIATPAISDLARLLSSEYSRGPAALCLTAIGPAALPTLSNAVATAPDPRVRWAALEAFGNLRSGAQSVSPLLLEIIQRNEPTAGFSLADLSLRVLVESETNGRAMMPLLIKCLADTNTAPGAAYGLARLETAGIPVLLQAITNENGQIRSAAAAALDMDFHRYTYPRMRFNNFNISFNLKLRNIRLSSYSGNEYRRIEPVLLRYTSESNAQFRAAANNALTYLTAFYSNAPAQIPLLAPSD